MASLHRQKGRPFWFCAYRGADGKRHNTSTKTTSLKQARKVQRQLERLAERAKERLLTVENARRILRDALDALLGDLGVALPTLTIREHFDGWLKRHERSWSETTVPRYRGVVKGFIDHLGKRADTSLETLTAADITRFRDELAQAVSPSTVNTALKVVRAALNSAFQEDLLHENPARRVKNIKEPSTDGRRPFTMPELVKLWQHADREWRTMIALGMFTGMRLQDASRLTWGNIDLAKREITVTTKKTGRIVIVPMHPDLRRQLERLPVCLDQKEPLSPGLYLRGSGWLSNKFYDVMSAAGLVPKRTHGQQVIVTMTDGRRHVGQVKSDKMKRLSLLLDDGSVQRIDKVDIRSRRPVETQRRRRTNSISFHALRHSYVTGLKAGGAGEAVAKDLAGHETVAISRQYTHLDAATKRLAIERMPSLLDMIEQPQLKLER